MAIRAHSALGRERIFTVTAEGRQEGLQQGRATLLARLLQLKFGPLDQATQLRLEQADEATLDLWAERILSAQSLGDVLA